MPLLKDLLLDIERSGGDQTLGGELREENFRSHFARPSAIQVDRDGTLRAGANPLKRALVAGLE